MVFYLLARWFEIFDNFGVAKFSFWVQCFRPPTSIFLGIQESVEGRAYRIRFVFIGTLIAEIYRSV